MTALIQYVTVILEYFDFPCCLVDQIFWIFGVQINRVPQYSARQSFSRCDQLPLTPHVNGYIVNFIPVDNDSCNRLTVLVKAIENMINCHQHHV